MSTYNFSIMQSVREAYAFVWEERSYLSRISALPLLMHVGTGLYRELMLGRGASMIEYFLWGLPATVLFGWFMFVEARLILLGERLDRLPQDRESRLERQRNLRASVIIVVLFNMFLVAVSSFMQWSIVSQQFGKDTLVTAVVMLLIGMMFWGLRFGVAHILAAVGFPIRTYIFAVNGIFFSIRLLALGLLCTLPAAFLFDMLQMTFVDDPRAPGRGEIALLVILSAPISIFIYAVMNAAGAFMLRQILAKVKP